MKLYASRAEVAYVSGLLMLLKNGKENPISGDLECFGLSFEIFGLNDVKFRSKIRNFNYKFADKFFQWTWSGASDPRELQKYNSNTANFTEISGRNTAHSPRIMAQLPRILEELHLNANTRRANCVILYPEDSELLAPKREGRSKQEYPCTVGMNWYIRDNKLHGFVQMRSNCMSKTICYDYYNQIHIMKAILKELNTHDDMNLQLGYLNWNITNAHILKNDIEYAQNIIDDYKENHPDFFEYVIDRIEMSHYKNSEQMLKILIENTKTPLEQL